MAARRNIAGAGNDKGKTVRTRVLTAMAAAILAALFVAFLSFRSPDTDPRAMRAKYGAPPSQFVNLGGGLTVHLRDTGPRDAAVLLLIHGMNDSLYAWEPWAVRLDKRYRVIRVDLPGHGLTGASPTGYAPLAMAKVIDRIRARLGIATMVVVGHSMGGGVAWHYALLHPDRVRALVLLDSVGQPEPSGGGTSPIMRIVQTPGLRELALQITPRSMVADGLRSAFHDPAKVSAAMIDRSWELLRYPGNRRAMLDRFALPADAATPAQLARLTMPVLILWGSDDQMIPVASAYWLHARIPGSRLILYPDTGHAVMEERDARSAADFHRFLADLPIE